MIVVTLFLTAGFFITSLFFLNYICKKRKNKSLKAAIVAWIRSERKRLPRTRKVLAGFLILITFGAILFGCYNLSNRIAFIRPVGSVCEWRESNGQSYLYVEADTFYDAGYLYGFERAYNIVTMKYLLIVMGVLLGVNYFEGISIANDYLPYVPDDFQQEILGISEGASAGSGFYLTFEDVLFQACMFDIFYGQQFLPEGMGCTSFGSVNKDNTTIIGQNIDLVQIIGDLFGFFLHLKIGNNPSIFSFCLGGGICPFPIGKNQNGLTVVTNLVRLREKPDFTTPTFVLATRALMNEKTPDDFYDNFFSEGKISYGMNLIIANESSMVAIQALPTNFTKTTPTNITHSNTYLNPYWQGYLLDPDYSKDRQQYAEALMAISYSDNFTTLSEMNIMLGDSPIIARDEEGMMTTKTTAFLTSTTFGIGNTNGNIGIIPI